MLLETLGHINDLFRTGDSLKRKLHSIQLEPPGSVIQQSVFAPLEMLAALHAYASSQTRDMQRNRDLCDALSALLSASAPKAQTLSITEIDGLWASKTVSGRKGEPLTCLGDLAAALVVPEECGHYRPHITFSTDEDFARNTCSVLSRFGGKFTVHYHAWTNRYFIANDDGSHRLAAVYRQCIEQRREFLLPCNVTEWRLSDSSVRYITSNYLAAISSNDSYNLWGIFRDFQIHPLMFDFYAAGGNFEAILIPRRNSYSRLVQNWFDNSCAQGVLFDLSEFLAQRLLFQNRTS